MSEAEGRSKRDALIIEYQKYVNNVVGLLIQKMGLPSQYFEEFVAAGQLGLVEAAGRFDFSGGRSFKSFAFLRIRGAVIDSIRECADCSGKAYKYARALQAAHNAYEDTVQSNEDKEGDAESKLAQVLDIAAKGALAFRLSVSDVEEEMANTADIAPDPENKAIYNQDLKNLSDGLATLTENERLVIREFYFNDRSFSEIASSYEGLSKSWTSRLHSKALSKLKSHLSKDPRSREN